MGRRNRTFSDRQAGRLQRLHRTAHAIPAVPADTTPAALPSTGETVNLGEQGTCLVVGMRPGPGGLTMVDLRCVKAGRRTTPGDQFALTEPAVRRLLVTAHQHNLEERLHTFWGTVAQEIARLGPSSWLPFLGWLLTIKEEQLPKPAQAQQHEGVVADFYTLHARVMASFHLLRVRAPAVMFTVTLGRSVRATVADNLPMDELQRLAQAIRDEADSDGVWRRYRSFVADSIVRSAEVTRRLVHYAAEHQQRWLRTGKLLDQRLLHRSSPALLKACDASRPLINALVATIGVIRVGDREIEVESLFTASDFERERIVTVLAEMLTSLGCKDRNLLTLSSERALRARAEEVLNEGMPDYLRKPLSDDRFRAYLTLAAAQATPTAAAVEQAEHAFAAEAAELRKLFRAHHWRHDRVAEALGIAATSLAYRIHHRHAKHELADSLLDDRRAFVLRIYRKAVPGKTTADNMEFAGIRAVANAIGVEPATPVGLGQHVQDLVKDALIAGDAPRGDRIPKADVERALNEHRGYSCEWNTAQALGIRIATLHRLIEKHGLTHLVPKQEER